ncbi:hypothetical protein BGW80DRAFT_861832 [Lactifluus volemus]|nr:hypothetical protein BGW80DRAFT_861832 [Lactifluus volemus]
MHRIIPTGSFSRRRLDTRQAHDSCKPARTWGSHLGDARVPRSVGQSQRGMFSWIDSIFPSATETAWRHGRSISRLSLRLPSLLLLLRALLASGTGSIARARTRCRAIAPCWIMMNGATVIELSKKGAPSPKPARTSGSSRDMSPKTDERSGTAPSAVAGRENDCR